MCSNSNVFLLQRKLPRQYILHRLFLLSDWQTTEETNLWMLVPQEVKRSSLHKNVYFCHRLCLRSPHEHSVIENIKFLFLKNFWIFSEDLTKDLVSLDIYQIQTGYWPSFFYGFTICGPFVVFQMSCNSGRICILVASCTFQNDKSYL